jgi:hypothetical protein
VILGAGYSVAAGLPSTASLFEERAHIASRGAEARFQKVWRDYDLWRTGNPDTNFEEYLSDLYLGERTAFGPPFSWAVELIAAVLSTPRGQDASPINPRYGIRLTRPLRCSAHDGFWKCVLSLFGDAIVVTTNYDLCVERCLRHRRIARSSMPGCFYGGLPLPQTAEGVALPWRTENRMRTISMEGTIPVFKVHGSLNWVLREGQVSLYQDARAAFRHGGDVAIVPPIPEKQVPLWLQSVWMEAERQLARANTWIVCGYSLPPYDLAMRQMLTRAVKGKRKALFLLDPASEKLSCRWKEMASWASVVCLSGLPNGTGEFRESVAGTGDGMSVVPG